MLNSILYSMRSRYLCYKYIKLIHCRTFAQNTTFLNEHNLNLLFNNGKCMPIIGLGTYQTTNEEIEAAVNCALEAGYRHIDTAYLYRNEAAIGNVLKKWLESGKVKRNELFIVSKLPWIANRAECVEKYLKASLDALKLEYLDLYLIHSPVGIANLGNDDLLPLNECKELLIDCETDLVSLWKGMEEEVEKGRTISIGLSNFNSEQIMRIFKSCKVKPVNLQIECHIYFQQRELVAFCRGIDMTVCAYAPLGSGGHVKSQTKQGDHSSFHHASPLEDCTVLEIAKAHKKTAGQVLLRYLIERGIAVIPKSKSPERIVQNFQVFDFRLSAEETQLLNKLDKGSKGRIFHLLYPPGMSKHPEYPFHIPY